MREAADLIIGNLNEDGYLIASDDELLGVAPPASSGSRCRDRQEHCQRSASPGLWPRSQPGTERTKMLHPPPISQIDIVD